MRNDIDFKNIFSLFPLPGLVLFPDHPRYTIVAVNDAFCFAIVQESTNLIGKSIFEVFTSVANKPFVADLQSSLLTSVNTKATHKFSHQLYSVPGKGSSSFETRHWEFENIPVLDENQEVTCIILSLKNDDINKMESITFFSGLNRDRDTYNLILDNALIPFMLTKPDGAILQANKAACDLFGYSMDEFRQLGRMGIIDHGEASIFDKIKDRKDKGWAEGEITGIKKNGELFPIEFSSVVFLDHNGEERTSTLLIDISERKKAEREMMLLINNTEESFILLDKKLRICSFNKQFQKIYKKYFGFDIEKGDFILDYALPERKKILKEIYGRVLLGSYEEDEIAIPLEGGGIITFALKYSPALDENGRIIGAFITGRDITEQKKIKQHEEDSEKNYKYLFENNPSPLFIWDFETLRILDCNEEVLLKYGYSREEFLELTIRDIRPEEDIALINAVTQSEEVYGKIHKRIWRHKKKSREIMLVEISGHLMDYNGRRASLVQVNDVTEREKALAQLKNNEIRLRAASKIAKLGYWSIQMDGQRLTWSDEVYDIFGVSKDATIINFNTFYEAIHPDDRTAFTIKQKLALEGESELDLEHRILLPDGSVKWVRGKGSLVRGKNGMPSFFEGTVQDITEYKNIQIALQEHNVFIETTLENLPIGIAVNKIDEGTVTFLNKKFVEIYGWPREVLTDVSAFFKNVYPDEHYRKDICDRILNDIKSGDINRMSWDEITIAKQNGEERIVNAKNIPLYDQNLMISTVVDVTERLKYINTIETQNKKLKEIAWIQSHVVRSPLAKIMGLIDVIKNYSSSQEEKEELLGHLYNTATELDDVIRDITEKSNAIYT